MSVSCRVNTPQVGGTKERLSYSQALMDSDTHTRTCTQEDMHTFCLLKTDGQQFMAKVKKYCGIVFLPVYLAKSNMAIKSPCGFPCESFH